MTVVYNSVQKPVPHHYGSEIRKRDYYYHELHRRVNRTIVIISNYHKSDYYTIMYAI